MGETMRQAVRAWLDAALWPKGAAVAAPIVLVGLLAGGGAVEGDALSKALLVPAVIGAATLIVSLPRQTVLPRVGAVIAADYLARFHLATPPAGQEATPPSLIVNPLDFYAVHEGLAVFTALVVVVEAVGAVLLRSKAPAAPAPFGPGQAEPRARGSAPGSGWSSPPPGTR